MAIVMPRAACTGRAALREGHARRVRGGQRAGVYTGRRHPI